MKMTQEDRYDEFITYWRKVHVRAGGPEDIADEKLMKHAGYRAAMEAFYAGMDAGHHYGYDDGIDSCRRW